MNIIGMMCNVLGVMTASISASAEAAKEQIAATMDVAAEMLTTETLIADLALILVLGALATLVFKKLRQPIVLGYIVAGFLASPHMSLVPSVMVESNIEFWAQIGIVVLLFTLGLEFSFKKLMNVGGSAVITAMIIVAGMMTLGYITGKILHFGDMDSLFLGGMLSMSSTTIIIKAFTDLKMRQKKFTSLVFAVLICEDLFAVVMMVVLSSVAINNTVEGGEMLISILKLLFFLVIWFTVGVFLLPSFFKRISHAVNDEMLLVISMGLCFLMAVFSVQSGFSMALGAFVMGSILAGTSQAERIDRVVKPVKDLFGAVFFISVGLMVDPVIIQEYWVTIAVLSMVVIVGMITFGTAGMLVTGQPLKIAMESGFSLTQIGEFAFIIASMGMSLGVLDKDIYPIVVAVSVITTFFTPYFIKAADPCYSMVEKILPERLQFLLHRYSKQEAESETKLLWKTVLARNSWKILLYTSLLIAIMIVSNTYLQPLLLEWLGDAWGRFVTAACTIAVMSPFLFALASPSTYRAEFKKLSEMTSRRSDVPLVVISLFRLILADVLVLAFLYRLYSKWTILLLAAVMITLTLFVFSKKIRRRMAIIESRFLSNLNQRELHKSGKDAPLISDLHLAHMTVGYDCPFVGEKLRNSDLRKKYGANIASITRGANFYPVPTGDMRIFPGDQIAIVGTDEQIQKLLPIIEQTSEIPNESYDKRNVEFMHFELNENSPIVGKTVATAGLRDEYGALLVAIQRKDDYIKPTGEEMFAVGDVVWLVGNAKRLLSIK